MMKSFGPITNEQVAWLTDNLLSDSSTKRIIERGGIHGDFLKVDDEELDSFVRDLSSERKFGFGQELAAGEYEYMGVHPFNLNLAIVLARRLAEGLFDDSMSQTSVKFLEANYQPMPPRYGPAPKFHAADIIAFAKVINSDPVIGALVERTTLEGVWTDEDDETYGKFERAYLKKYGLQSKSFPGTALRLCRMRIRGQVSSFEDDLALKYLRRHHDKPSIACCVFEGVKNV